MSSPFPSPLSSCHPFCHQSVFLKISLRLTLAFPPHPFGEWHSSPNTHLGRCPSSRALFKDMSASPRPFRCTSSLLYTVVSYFNLTGTFRCSFWSCLRSQAASLPTSLPGIIFFFSSPRICTLPSINEPSNTFSYLLLCLHIKGAHHCGGTSQSFAGKIHRGSSVSQRVLLSGGSG